MFIKLIYKNQLFRMGTLFLLLSLGGCKKAIDLDRLPTKQLHFISLPKHVQIFYKEAAFYPKNIIYFSSTNKEDSVSYKLFTQQHYLKMLVNGYTIRFYINGKNFDLDMSKHGLPPFLYDNGNFYYIDGLGYYSEYNYLKKKVNCVNLTKSIGTTH